MNAKKQALLHCTRFSVTLASPKLLSLGIKNKYIYFVLHSTFRNFVTATVGWESNMAILLTNMTHITEQYDSYCLTSGPLPREEDNAIAP